MEIGKKLAWSIHWDAKFAAILYSRNRRSVMTTLIFAKLVLLRQLDREEQAIAFEIQRNEVVALTSALFFFFFALTSAFFFFALTSYSLALTSRNEADTAKDNDISHIDRFVSGYNESGYSLPLTKPRGIRAQYNNLCQASGVREETSDGDGDGLMAMASAK
ncbi:hypothetical protein RND71_002084 [Anisodus tanguticus]|uniref:Uncharacterized protein n=1 Tax=Anisodus tanguticus TaxID=243964 RepID=A0AAE1T3B3_9SOLA|nr:hypothetical protein RND71_002084 [Anisodus tanguticus]